jgi:hypothetical protein
MLGGLCTSTKRDTEGTCGITLNLLSEATTNAVASISEARPTRSALLTFDSGRGVSQPMSSSEFVTCVP